jgi:hypothetical protein
VTGVTNHRNHAEERRAEEKTTTESLLVDNRRPRTAGAGVPWTLRLAAVLSYRDGIGGRRRRSDLAPLRAYISKTFRSVGGLS